MRNMRIDFGDDRDAVIKELERLGYVESKYNCGPYSPEEQEDGCNIIVAYRQPARWTEYCHDAYTPGYPHATLEDLKKMNKS